MTKHLITILLVSVILVGCLSNHNRTVNEQETTDAAEKSQDDTLGIKSYIEECNIEGIDSVMIIRSNGKDLFRIALGGNVELICDTIMKFDNKKVGLLTLADYFQDNQIFYVLYYPHDSISYQSDRLYLPYLAMQLSDYNQLAVTSISKDSIFLFSRKEPTTTISLSIDSLQCDENGIINYYEFE